MRRLLPLVLLLTGCLAPGECNCPNKSMKRRPDSQQERRDADQDRRADSYGR